jgi:hypothetical protein
MHYCRAIRRGLPRKFQHGPVVQRIKNKVKVLETGCWIFTGSLMKKGYGHISADGGARRVHRVMWENEFGPVPDGLELDHLCGQRACCNPQHLEAVTHTENIRRACQGTT